MTSADGDDYDETLMRYVERLALVLTESGIPRMPARVYAYVLADDATSYTARELAEGLRVSAAAISNSVRYLVQVGMLMRRREPGARSDHYVIDDDDLWGSVFRARSFLLDHWAEIMGEGADLLGEDRPGGRRLRQSQEFFRFMRKDVDEMMDRWHAYQREHHPGDAEAAEVVSGAGPA